jgi:UDP-N-acetylmuramoylalanine--D-glutamate ligase
MIKNRIKQDWQDKKIVVLGLGIENLSFLKFWHKHKLPGRLIICDSRQRIELAQRIEKLKNYGLEYSLGKDYKQPILKADIIIRSPGFPLFDPYLIKAKKKKIQITSALNLFFELCPTKNIIGVTGSKGKGTSASLIYSILKTKKENCFLGGNIGVAPFDFLDKLNEKSFVILELSSFQLEDSKYSPKISAITNVYHEHLAPADPLNPNYHKSFKKYLEAKLNITKYQTAKDYLILNKNFKTLLKSYKIKSQIKYFSKSAAYTPLAGDYNKENISLAETVASILKIKKSTVAEAIKSFKGLEHRLEFVKEMNSVKYYDNSFSTTPDSTQADLESFKKNIILIIGGADKGAKFNQIARQIKKSVKFVVLLDGQSNQKILRALKNVKYPNRQIEKVFCMPEAVKLAQQKSQAGDIALLSPACASFGMFKNYKERGQQFKKAVKKIK